MLVSRYFDCVIDSLMIYVLQLIYGLTVRLSLIEWGQDIRSVRYLVPSGLRTVTPLTPIPADYLCMNGGRVNFSLHNLPCPNSMNRLILYLLVNCSVFISLRVNGSRMRKVYWSHSCSIWITGLLRPRYFYLSVMLVISMEAQFHWSRALLPLAKCLAWSRAFSRLIVRPTLFR